MRHPVLLLLCMLLLAACNTEPTPFPAVLTPTPSPTPRPTALPPVRYALAANVVDRVAALNEIERTAQVELLTDAADPAQLGDRFDIVVTYGVYDGWDRSAITPQVSMVINPQAAPLTPELADTLRQGINPQAVVEALQLPGVAPASAITTSKTALREQLANVGRPDGLSLVVGHTYVPGIEQIVAQLEAINVRVRTVALDHGDLRDALDTGRVQVGVVTWAATEEQRAWRDLYGAAYTVDLYSLPISYLAVPSLSVRFTADGWPIAQWSG